MYRLIAFGAAVFWMAAMSALFVRDVWPAWTAQNPPPMTADQLRDLVDRHEQYALYDANNKRIGTAWNNISDTAGTLSMYGTLLINGVTYIPVIRVETVTEFDQEGGLDTFKLDVFGVPMTVIQVRGERHGIYFPCELKLGPVEREVNLDMSASRMIGEAMRPFSFLPLLEVGQSWRMQLLDPIAAVLAQKTEFTSVVARVTAMETITHNGEEVECFVVELSPHEARAWVNRQGRVLVQEVQMPGVGRLTVREEPYEAEKRSMARQTVQAWSAGQGGLLRGSRRPPPQETEVER